MDRTTLDIEVEQALLQEDALGSVIRFHILLERELNKFLKRNVKNSEAVPSLKIGFHSLLQLAIALGLNPDLKNPLLAINKIRNKYAHQEQYELTKTDADGLYSKLSTELKRIIQEGYLSSQNFGWMECVSFSALDPRNKFILCSIVIKNSFQLVRTDV